MGQYVEIVNSAIGEGPLQLWGIVVSLQKTDEKINLLQSVV